ncbi:hypothetical protein FFLO_06837 [Filobasidium floriforme]|uniref:Pyridoxamine 5'-phosphate oxidase Alr4036 family FMN-binding domain-containing protein n=1 Tax=Filobasidium floriforme TaxID=5210 RepID=A0A8K0JE44_9TREE|nr:hypothetical protein FFLO_06837 [Filobasidium floriforme]
MSIVASTTTRSTPGWVQDVESSKPGLSCTYALATLSLDQSRPEIRNVGIKDLISLSPSARPDRQALLCSTDARTPKVLQLVQNPRCSLSTWVPEELLQIRIQAMARTYSSQGWIGGEEAVSGVEVDMKRLRREMWRSESFHGRTRAWHANPTPGTDLEGSRDGWTEQLAVSTALLEGEDASPSTGGLGSEEAELKADEVLASILENRENDSAENRSYKNFALIVFEPYEVDVVRMAKSGFDRRTRWTKQGDDWISKEVVP